MDSSFVAAILFVSFGIFSLGPYLVWPSRWNILGHFQFAFCVVVYFIPLLWTEPTVGIGHDTISLFTSLMAFGALFYLIGLPLGLFSPRYSVTRHRLLQMQEVSYRKVFNQRVVKLTFWA